MLERSSPPWTNRHTLLAPSSKIRLTVPTPGDRYQPVMVYDKARGRTVLFGGRAGAHDTWEWDGQQWRQIEPQ